MELILHIGHYKTGTTSIQHFLYNYKDVLLKRYKLLYPLNSILSNKSKGQVLLAYHYAKKTGKDFDKIINITIDEILSLKPHKVCISSEELCVYNAAVYLLERIEKLFEKIIILFYIRRQDTFAESSYKERIKNSDSKLTKSFHKSLQDIDFMMKYDKILNKIVKNFPIPKIQVIAKIYDRSLFPEGNVIIDFLSILGIDMPEAKEYKIEANPSLSHISTLALRKINERFNLPNKERLKVIHYLLKLDKEEGPGPLKTFFTLEERIEFLERFKESNERLFREWFNSENKFVLTPEEIEFYREQDKIPKEEIERLVDERYQKVVENVIKKPKVYIPVEISKLAREGDIVDRVVIDKLYLDLLKDGRLIVEGVVVLKPEVKEEYRLLMENGEGIKEVRWGISSPGYAKMYPENPYAKNARFKVEGVVLTEEKPIKLYLEDKDRNRMLIYEIKTALTKE
uniref:Uncharacterized protein n=1 Tax=Thermodesulfobacterium geofontis TaxID=1295609 RepID=A0A7V6CEK1_9BACT